MDSFVLLACAWCAFGHPVFLVLSMFAGTVPVAYLLLRPYTRNIQTWGFPQIDVARLVSLALMLACLVPLWFIGRQENSTPHVTICLGGLAACCIYLWLRSCWLLDTHHVTSAGRELLFPGLLAPAILIFGTIIGSWVLGILLVAPWWPMIVVPHTILCAAIGIPVGLLVSAGLNYTFSIPEKIPSSNTGDVGASVAPIVAEQSDEREPQ